MMNGLKTFFESGNMLALASKDLVLQYFSS